MTTTDRPAPVEVPGEEYIPDQADNALCSGDPNGEIIADFWIVRQLRVFDDRNVWMQVLYALSREKALAKLKPVLMGLNFRQRHVGDRTYLYKDDTDMFVVYRQVLRTGWMDGTALQRREVQEETILLKDD